MKILKKELIYYLVITCISSSNLEAVRHSYTTGQEGYSQRSIKLDHDNFENDPEKRNLMPLQPKASFSGPDRDIESQQPLNNKFSLSSLWKGLCWVAGGIILGGAVIGGAKFILSETSNVPATMLNGINLSDTPIQALPHISVGIPDRKTKEQLRREEHIRRAKKFSLKNYPYTKPAQIPKNEALQGEDIQVTTTVPLTTKNSNACSYANGTVLGSYQCVEGLWRQIEPFSTTHKVSTPEIGWKRLEEIEKNGYHVIIEGKIYDKREAIETTLQ
ncbi:MAG: hypothetical protein ACRCTK_03215 [Alphaproteobacteria bacterium]